MSMPRYEQVGPILSLAAIKFFPVLHPNSNIDFGCNAANSMARASDHLAGLCLYGFKLAQ